MGEFFKTIGDYLGLESEVKEANKSVTYTWNITQEKLNQVNNKYPNVMILVLAFIWANDGKAQDGLSYATEYLIQVLNVENIVFNSFIAETLCKNDANLKHQFAERIIDQSLIQNRVHMYIERVLDFIKKDNSGNAVWQKVFQVMEKLLSNSPYAINSDLLFFRFYRSPHLEGHNLNLTDLEEKYYTTSAGNLYERLKNEEDIKNDSNQAIFALSTLGIYKFNNGFAQRMFKKIVDLYGDLNKTTQTNFKNFINTHNHFFSSLRQIKIDLDDYGNITKRIYQDYEPYEKFRKFK